ncbi:hypothetical protein H9661_04090 [Clostridium sp. Sa3CVN1]|uniref:Thioesterase domain-containing protein n=1 Tax=Clostridium cibarium TaxID=2762247 RepID=A0ABR8PQT4_9CLOT|nr:MULTISPECIES: thioesterase domain-containing protein [Clostridium]MBD7910534.1 hypothetical protein [Clostridium cibarium]
MLYKFSFIKSDYRSIHNLNDVEFKKELLRLGETPIEVLENDDWAKIFLPVLRADFKVVEEYTYTIKANKLNCDLTILYGEKDYLTINNLEKWKEHTNNKCTFLKFSGGHFFIDNNTWEIVNIINNTLIPKLE